jgi:anaerobic C4-dicarboxylate transporter
MKRCLQILFGFILVSMLIVTSWASMHESVFAGGAKLLIEPWGIATLFDTYFAFLTFYVWVCYKERSHLTRLFWLIAIVLLGNIAMAIYVLLELKKLGKDSSFEKLLLRQPAARPHA